MLICWLVVYLLVVAGLPVMTVLLVLKSGKLVIAVLAALTPLYFYLWLAVYSYYQLIQSSNKNLDLGWEVQMTRFSLIFLPEREDESGDLRREKRGGFSCKYRLVPKQEDKSESDNGSDFFVDKGQSENIQVKNR